MNQLKSINPYTMEVVSSVDELTDFEIGEILGRSVGTFGEYRMTSFDYRRERMMKAAEVLEKNALVYAGLITSEMGKLLTEAEAEVRKCAWVCRYYSEHAEQFLRGRTIATDAEISRVIYEPLGPILAIMPWNFPFWQVFRFAVPTVMAGNTAMLKHASNVQGCAKAIEEVFRLAGFPNGVFQNLSVTSAKVEGILSFPDIRAVTLTGSEAAGSSVAAVAGKYLKKCVLELGGNNAFVVLNDADIDHAVETALKARLQNSGQSCIAAKRFILEQGIHDQFLEKLEERLKEYQPGDPADPATTIAPLFSVMQAQEVRYLVDSSVLHGANLVYGGEMKDAFYTPAIVTGVMPGMEVFEEETFGPVFAVTKATSPSHALELSNQSAFGLGMQVFTSSEESTELFINGAEEGAVFINEMVKSDPRLPFGGIKKSGFGRELAKEGILEFVNVKTIYLK